MLIKFSRAIFDGSDKEYQRWMTVVTGGDVVTEATYQSEVSPPAAFEMCYHLITIHRKLTPRLQALNKAYIRGILDQVPTKF